MLGLVQGTVRDHFESDSKTVNGYSLIMSSYGGSWTISKIFDQDEKQAGAELCQAKHSLSLLHTN